MPVIIDHENATHAASLVVSLTHHWVLKAPYRRPTNNKQRCDGNIGRGILPCESVRHSYFRRKSTDLSALQSV